MKIGINVGLGDNIITRLLLDRIKHNYDEIRISHNKKVMENYRDNDPKYWEFLDEIGSLSQFPRRNPPQRRRRISFRPELPRTSRPPRLCFHAGARTGNCVSSATPALIIPSPNGARAFPIRSNKAAGRSRQRRRLQPRLVRSAFDHGESVSVVLSADSRRPHPNAGGGFAARRAADALALEQAHFPEDDAFGRQLALAARAYVVRRGAGQHRHRRLSVVPRLGPRYLDRRARACWRRAWSPKSRNCSSLSAVFQPDGTMPNTIHGEDASNRDTSDAPLWYGVRVRGDGRNASADSI